MLYTYKTPYSLGKLIDWKLFYSQARLVAYRWATPYSLGKLIDWKRGVGVDDASEYVARYLPTR